jgi:hypothetical protein
MVQRVICLFLCLSCLFVVTLPVSANETDQFNLPPKPLADIAPEVEAYVAQKIQKAIDNLNDQIVQHEGCVNNHPFPSAAFGRREGSTAIVEAPPPRRSPNCGTQKQEQSKLDGLRTPDAVALAVYNQLGAGNIFLSDTGKWLNTHKFEHEPSRYTTTYGESIYVSAPVNYATISPTIRVYGVEFGTDKFDHLFQQGYTYYRKYNAARKAGKTDAQALKAAVDYGRFTENTFFGYTVSGVYSNADLAANIAGLKFYQNLANDIQLGDTTQLAILKMVDGRWDGTRTLLSASPLAATSTQPAITADEASAVADKSVRVPILRPFITDHLNEALNPSNYLFFLYPVVKNVVQKRACPEWHAAFPTLTRESVTKRTAALTTWNGLDYGYKQTSRQPRLADLCFADPKSPSAKE